MCSYIQYTKRMQKSYRVRERLHDNLLEHLLLSRGIVPEEFAAFLAPDFVRDSHNPFLLPDMEKAVERILSAAKNNEQVGVWSDYDADGLPGGVMLAQFLRTLGLSVRHYVPHRHKEGYGLNTDGLAELAAQGITLLVTVDLGTTDVEQISFAKGKGIDIIVTDHPLEPPVLPEAFALINPKLKSSRYPFDGLCGAGVAWKLVQAVLSKHRPEGFAEGYEKWYLDLVGIGTLSDMVPLRGENRMLAHFGLTVMRRARRPGLAALLNLLRIKPATLTEDDVGFMISPRINAASRMDSPEAAARLLATEDKVEAGELALALNKINDERKVLVATTVKEVNKRLQLIGLESPVIVMGNPAWRPGILGLVANSLAEAHGKPAFVWGRGGSTPTPHESGLLRGSCRSDGATNVVDLMGAVPGVFEDFGGHFASGGFSLPPERAHELPARLAEAYELLRAQRATPKEVVADRELELAEAPHALRDLDKLAPFGVGFEKPLFIFPGVSVAGARTFGKQQNHLELSLTRPSTTLGASERIAGIAFFSTPESFTKKPGLGDSVSVVGNVERDWRGAPRLRVVDIV